MAWDPTRPVPWRRLTREWLLYVAIMFVVVLAFFRDQSMLGIVAGLIISLPLYLGFGYVLAKFGYQRKTWGELRDANRAEGRATGGASTKRSRGASADDSPGPRPKPPPTRRTGGTSGRPGGARKRR